MPPDERLEDWPPWLRLRLAAGLHGRLQAGSGSKVWEFGEFRLDPFDIDPDLSRELRLGLTEAVVMVLRDPSDPKHLYAVIGVAPPADGLGEFVYQILGVPDTQRFIARQASAYTRGSYVIGEMVWTGENLALDRIVNPLQARPGRERQEIAAALEGLRVLSNLTRRKSSAMSDEEAFENAVSLGLEWLADSPGATPAEFGRKQLTAKRCTGPDATDKWLKEKHFGIRQVQQELARRLQTSA